MKPPSKRRFGSFDKYLMHEDISAIRNHFLDNLTAIGIDESQIVMDNQPSTDVDESRLWVRFQIRPGEKRPSTLGKRKIMTQIGQVILQVFGPKGSGSESVYALAGNFADTFRDWVNKSATGSVRAYYSTTQAYPSLEFLQVNASVSYESNRREPK